MSSHEQPVHEADILAALRTVIEPELHRDLVTLGMIKNLTIRGSEVSLAVELTTPACPLQEKIETDVKQAVMKVRGVTNVSLNMTSNVRQPTNPWDNRAPLPGVKNLIPVGSGKGGVGKSTVAANLAVSLAESGAKTGLLDADIYGPSIPMMMGAKDKPKERGGKMVPLERYGVKLISLGFFMTQDTPVVWRGPMVGKAVTQLLKDVDWGELDYLIIDLPPGTGDAQLSLVQAVPITGAVVVTTPQDVALLDVIKCIAMFQKVNVPVLGLIENMSYFVCPHCGERTDILKHGGGREASAQLSIPFLGEVPLDPAIPIGGDEGVPIVKADPRSPQALRFKEIAGNLAARISVLNFELSEKAEKRDFVPLKIV
ncbi:MAG: Mrp/NBP35 family ATP-binding protein [Candidatus Tectomicrobia bacterium]|nr:Mrp/NBP35 family ATP-binding protein [Candidatus Tectomicrobia bacterium]